MLLLLSILTNLSSHLTLLLSPLFPSVVLFVFYNNTADFSFHFAYILHFMSLVSTTDGFGVSYRQVRCPSIYTHKLSPADDICCLLFLASDISMLKPFRYEASSNRMPNS
jgi:predicted small integral membrane protein